MFSSHVRSEVPQTLVDFILCQVKGCLSRLEFAALINFSGNLFNEFFNMQLKDIKCFLIFKVSFDIT